MSHTDTVIERLRASGIELAKGSQSSGMFRLQPKVTGCERRVMLSEWRKYSQSYIDCHWTLNGGKTGRGVDFMNPVKELATCPIGWFKVEMGNDDWCLWAWVEQPKE